MYECLTIPNVKWYIDRDYLKHMTEDISLFYSFTQKNKWYVSDGDNNKGNIIGISIVGKFLNPTIREVLLIIDLRHNLLSIS